MCVWVCCEYKNSFINSLLKFCELMKCQKPSCSSFVLCTVYTATDTQCDQRNVVPLPLQSAYTTETAVCTILLRSATKQNNVMTLRISYLGNHYNCFDMFCGCARAPTRDNSRHTYRFIVGVPLSRMCLCDIGHVVLPRDDQPQNATAHSHEPSQALSIEPSHQFTNLPRDVIAQK